MQHQLLSNWSFFDPQLISKAEANDVRQAFVRIAILIVVIVCAITFIQWLRRAYHNLHKAKITGLKYSEGWAAGAWFVPIMNLFAPYQIMRDVWVKTKDYCRGYNLEVGDTEELDSTKQKGTSTVALVGWWWAAYLIGNTTESISSNIERRAGASIDQLILSTRISMVASIINIVALILVIKMIRESQHWQNLFLDVWNTKKEATEKPLSESEDILD